MSTEFVHLHNHSDYSLLDAAQSVEMLCDRVSELKMDTIALTEHGNLFSMIPFYKEAVKKGIKPIIGCELYIAMGSHTKKERIPGKGLGYHHLVLLVQNEIGYKNLMKLVSIGYLNGFYYKPRVDKELLKKYNEGLIATSGCLKGEVNEHAYLGDYEKAKNAAVEYSEIFPNRFFLEVQDHNISEEKATHPIIKKLSSELNLPMVATNDCHYARCEHWEAHDILFCLGTQKKRDDVNRLSYEPEQFYIKSQDEMYNKFNSFSGAIENTRKIADMCDFSIPMGKLHLPTFPIPKEYKTEDPDKYLRIICEQNIKKKYDNIDSKVLNRLNFELDVIKKMGFAGYFLIVMDFIQYAKNNSIPVGPGRGSAVGSIVSYATGITDIDPLKYNLLFERFLNPERISMPDIDIDFCIEGRQSVIDYIKTRYGDDSVSQIITFGRMKAKSVLRDVGRVLDMPYDQVDRIAKLIPDDLKITLDKAFKKNKEFSEIKNIDKTHENLIEYSRILEGLNRHASVHAAGVVIAPNNLTEYIPLYKSASTGDVTSQVDMNGLEDLGLLKMDFLGLRTLTVIDKAIKMIYENHNIKIDIEKLHLNDEKTYDLFSNGKTVGIFQFESGGMREHLKNLQPSTLEDLIAMNALYRPGPMENIPEFINRKKGKKRITYLNSSLEPILKETYGIIVYQEQVMQIASEVAGFTLAKADIMRKAMGKKKIDEMAAIKVDFVDGAIKKGFDKKKSVEIFDLVEKFAQYGFNKSHSAAYALVAYRTAWLKAHYPAEFLAATMTTEMNDTKRIVSLINEAQSLKITIIPPNINQSKPEFSVNKKSEIVYGLAAIKNIGYKASQLIYKQRKNDGKYNSIFSMCKSLSNGIINKKILESLIISGACDSLNSKRSQMYEVIDQAIKFGQNFNNNQNQNQASLFSNDDQNVIVEPEIPLIPEWNKNDLLAKEKEILGFYLTGDPVEDYKDDIKELSIIKNNNRDSEIVRTGGIIVNKKLLYDKKNRPWAIIEISNQIVKAEVFVFSKEFELFSDLLEKDSLIFVSGTLSTKNQDKDILKIICNKLYALNNIRDKITKSFNIIFDESRSKNELEEIKNIISNNKGKYPFIIHFKYGKNQFQKIKSRRYLVSNQQSLLKELRNILGEKNVWLS